MMKRILFALMAALLTLTALCVPVSAESTETISAVDIDAVLNTDGTVSVTETWTVDYLGASDGFTRNLDLYTGSSDGMTLLQKYDEIKDVSVAIDGKPAPESATEMNAYIFQKSDDGSCYMIAVNSPSAQVTKTYTIGYTITGALKKKSGDANFSFMFIGDTLPYTCNNVTITVTPPEGIEADKISVPENSRGVVNEDNVVFAIKYVTKTFAAEMTMPDSVFEDGALVSYSAAKANLKAFGNSLLRVLPWILAVIAVIALAAFVLFGDRIRRAKLISVPLLLCKEDDVVGNHASSAGQIDKDKLFYLMSRGFNEAGAQLIIVESNIRPVIDKLGDTDLENKVLQAVREKMQFCYKKGDCHAKCTQRFPHLD